MHDQVHLTIATTLSIIITFVLHCIMDHIPVRQSYLQLSIDFSRDLGLSVRCLYNQRTKNLENMTCAYFFNEYDAFYYVTHALILLIVLIMICLSPKIAIHPCKILITLAAVEFLAQYFTSLNFWWKIDVLTIYWFVWQLISLMLEWICLVLLPPILIIEQGSFCVTMALLAWMWHFTFLRYIPLTLSVLWFWVFSVIDIFKCLHHRGFLYEPSLPNQPIAPRKKCLSDTYYIDGIDKWKTSGGLGLSDFFTYNILVLFALRTSSSMIIKICVTIGSIVSVQIGHLLTFLLRRLTKTLVAPGVPLPVITVSIYLFILNIIIPTNLNQCIEL